MYNVQTLYNEVSFDDNSSIDISEHLSKEIRA
jgi:hypothetical protein